LSSAFGSVTDGSTFKVWANYIYLDTEERRRFAQKGHEYLIEQVQHTGTDTVTAGSEVQKRLSYNHPVKELVFCLDDGTDTWNTSNVAPTVTANVARGVVSNCFISDSFVGAPLVLNTGSKIAEDDNGTLDTFKLVLNGQDRFKEQSGKYFNQVQPFVHHSGSPAPGIYAYSFALKPEEHQPTGTCNFSRIDNAQVAIKARAGTQKTTLRMFACNYNVLRIQSGMGGLAFSN
jgi:hypothetical protein